MSNKIEDADVRILAGLASTLAPDYMAPEDDPWRGSPFEWILRVPSRTKGAIGEALVAGWAAAKGFDVSRSPNSNADRIIHGHRVEIKMSTLWKNGGFKFQQIRDQQYDFVLCLGITPFDAKAWLLPKEIVGTYVIGHMGQHTGASGTDTAWISFQENDPYPWMKPYGDRFSEIEKMLLTTGRGSH